jgi:hypothetical protein
MNQFVTYHDGVTWLLGQGYKACAGECSNHYVKTTETHRYHAGVHWHAAIGIYAITQYKESL